MGELDEIIEISKRRGFFWPSFSIYGGVAGLNDYGPLGSILKDRIYREWKSVYAGIGGIEIDTPSVTPENVLKASGHVDRFLDLAVGCKNCKTKFKVESLLSDKGVENVPESVESAREMIEKIKIRCPRCGGDLGEPFEFHLMFPIDSNGERYYLRPETAQGIFVNFKLLLNYNRGKLPMIVYQQGKGYRNEISPRQGLIRQKEFNMAEVEVFLDPEVSGAFTPDSQEKLTLLDRDGKTHVKSLVEAVKDGTIMSEDHAYFLQKTFEFALRIGIDRDRLRFRQHRKDELAHYSKDCWDLEFRIDNSWVEITGISDRGTFDLGNHQKSSGENLSFEGEKLARVIEPASGIDRMFMAVLISSMKKRENGYNDLSMPDYMAPYPVAVLPLQKKDGLPEKAREFFSMLKSIEPYAYYDESGAIGRRYARQDEIGTPYCITIDYDTLEKGVVTIRERDSTEQITGVPYKDLLTHSPFLANPILKKVKK
ncbi:glycine--tRNA ligase [Cuniculiplasma sp. SKW3]|uniref:glycine--tRNA ligase n=1 Tax=unclassified Cuniculiplasma TaxID=2619706 RepID=UPI003FD04702